MSSCQRFGVAEAEAHFAIRIMHFQQVVRMRETAQVALDEMPNFGEVLEVDILVGPIAGEKTADNNRGSYQVQFSL